MLISLLNSHHIFYHSLKWLHMTPVAFNKNLISCSTCIHSPFHNTYNFIINITEYSLFG